MIYDAMRELRKEKKQNQSEIARILGTSQVPYSRYERGERDLPFKHLATLARFYGVSADYIAERTDERTPYRALEEAREGHYLPRLAALRKERGLSQSAVGEILRIAQRQYSRYETGAQAIPLKHLIALAIYYQVPLDYMLDLTDERAPHPHKEG